jgi:hypothetical protein
MKGAIGLTLALVTIFSATEGAAAPNKELYELQERCGKHAEDVFRKDYGGGGMTKTNDGSSVTSFENHYSATVNKCFFLEIVFSYTYKPKKSMSKMMTLFDLDDHKAYAMFFRSEDNAPFPCEVQEKVCHSESEWREFVKPYMEE